MNHRKLLIALSKALAVMVLTSIFVCGMIYGPWWLYWSIVAAAATAWLTVIFYWQ